jgi:nitroimidazol reductase NimA-like FMN-containing flavoprotein (pyridoxamine 5'-phosphate oxidase superfamily)
MTRTEPVRFFGMDSVESLALLERNHVGRLAFAHGARPSALVDIQPVHYVFADGWIFGRTSAGEKLSALEHNWSVAFEVDEIEALFEWRSVVVHGGFYILSPSGPPSDVALWQRALQALRTLIPDTLTDSDPVPFRNVLFGISIQKVSGRGATTLSSMPERVQSGA